MKKVIGNWLLDIGKYVATALILQVALLSDKEVGAGYFLINTGLLLTIAGTGLALIWSDIKKENK